MNSVYLITGVAGLLGSNFAKWIIDNKKGIVIGIDDLSGGYQEYIPKEVIFYKLDLNSFDQVIEIFKNHKIDYLVHFAAYAAEGLSPFIRTFNYKNNVLTTANLINCAIKFNIKRFIFTSSMAVYGNCGNTDPPFDETSLCTPIDPYGIAKYACELDLQCAQKQHNLEFCIIRPHNVYGIQQNIWDTYRNVLGIWIVQILNNKPITIYGNGSQTRAFTYIDDILEPMYNACVSEKAKNQIINLGGTVANSIRGVAETLSAIYFKKMKTRVDHIYLENRHEIKHAWTTFDKSIKLLDFKMKTDISSGLSKMLDWALTQPNRTPKKWSSYELDKGIYSYWKN